MRKFWSGFFTAAVVLVLAAYCFVRFGFIDPRADIPEDTLEKTVAMPALDASVDRRAPELRNPVSASDENLVAGMRMYQTQCSSCHGDIGHKHGMLAEALYPRPPQFMEDAPDMPENQNYYILQHGIRLSGMPTWKQTYNEHQLWQITTFLSHMDKLPPAVSQQWKAAACGSTDAGARDTRP